MLSYVFRTVIPLVHQRSCGSENNLSRSTKEAFAPHLICSVLNSRFQMTSFGAKKIITNDNGRNFETTFKSIIKSDLYFQCQKMHQNFCKLIFLVMRFKFTYVVNTIISKKCKKIYCYSEKFEHDTKIYHSKHLSYDALQYPTIFVGNDVRRETFL
ncbi:hypothetical protein PR048_020000 [Dryococelus australis]|uniref:Integrase catalytic domain-containing protein n=1 Tax=Dryococelus australis TaxID=614101 RepID=A0ABQ9H520_9NEOP|nr:hypothetical protein PR048_020000 [Dryococelus australis]